MVSSRWAQPPHPVTRGHELSTSTEPAPTRRFCLDDDPSDSSLAYKIAKGATRAPFVSRFMRLD